MTTPHPLYLAALAADEHLNTVLKARTGRTRWTMHANDFLIPEVKTALQAKYAADAAWLEAMRAASQARTDALGIE